MLKRATAPSDPFPFHQRSEVDIDADVGSVFAFLDDHRRLAGHMQKPSLWMAGATMKVETDELLGQAVGSLIRMSGRVLGLTLAVEEVVTERVPPWRKTWETRGVPRLLVVGAYRMGFVVSPRDSRSRLGVFIDYQLPAEGLSRGVGLIAGRTYASWCTRQMATDAAAALAES